VKLFHMATESSLYRKIQVVLDAAKSQKVHSIDELSREIGGLKPDNFLARFYDEDTDTFITGISEESIRRTVNLCHRLSLLRVDGTRTAEGVEASRKTQFDKVMAQQVRLFLKEAGVSLRDLNKVIAKSLRSDPLILTTCRTLWESTDGKVPYSTFSRMMTLLTQCGGAESSQKKVYLHIDVAE
jgi:hypothetical protein